MKNKMKKVLAITLALVMVFAMTATAFADADETATVKVYTVNSSGTATLRCTVSATAGQTVYDVVNSMSSYSPVWSSGVDVFDSTLTTKYLTSFMNLTAANEDYQYNSDGSGWSEDWGWLFTVGTNHVMPSFPNNPNHGMAMNQYTIQSGDTIDVVYTLTYTEWDASYNTTYSIEYPWY